MHSGYLTETTNEQVSRIPSKRGQYPVDRVLNLYSGPRYDMIGSVCHFPLVYSENVHEMTCTSGRGLFSREIPSWFNIPDVWGQEADLKLNL
jgi:hypothetical protein